MARDVFHLIRTVALLLGTATAFSFNGVANDDRQNLEYWSRNIHAIVFESMNVKNQVAIGHFAVETLPSAVLPLRLSSSYFPLSASARFPVGDLGLPGDLSLLDVYTFRFAKKDITGSKKIKRWNDLAKLAYSLRVRDWTDDSCEVEFSGKYRDSLTPVTVRLNKKKTTVIRVGRLFVAFTFVSAAIKADEVLLSATRPERESSIVLPKATKEPFPEYPPELSRRNKQGNFRFLAVITREGKVNRSHGIVLECFHWFFARNALEVIFNDWEFKPGQQDGQPIDIMGEIEVTYRLGPSLLSSGTAGVIR
jgi:hypothetical protein